MPATTETQEPTTSNEHAFAVTCIKCGEEGTVSLDLDDLATCNCRSCENSFNISDVREVLAQWAAVLKWIEMAPRAF